MTRFGSMIVGVVVGVAGAGASLAMAQGTPSVEQLQKQLDETNVQLRAAQDRKNELALENQKLQKRLTEIEQQNQAVREELETLENRAYFLREHYAAWQEFLDANAPIKAMWSAFFNSASTPYPLTDILGDGHWPFSVEG